MFSKNLHLINYYQSIILLSCMFDIMPLLVTMRLQFLAGDLSVCVNFTV